MDFVLGLPPTVRRGDNILVAVDRFSKSHFFHVGKLMMLPTLQTSDRDSKFRAHFWKTLWKEVSTNLDYSTTFHAQKYRQTEMTNRSLGNLLRSLIEDHPKEWEGI